MRMILGTFFIKFYGSIHMLLWHLQRKIRHSFNLCLHHLLRWLWLWLTLTFRLWFYFSHPRNSHFGFCFLWVSYFKLALRPCSNNLNWFLGWWLMSLVMASGWLWSHSKSLNPMSLFLFPRSITRMTFASFRIKYHRKLSTFIHFTMQDWLHFICHLLGQLIHLALSMIEHSRFAARPSILIFKTK